MPAPRLGVAQVALSIVEWTLAALVLYVLLPPSPLPWWGFVGAFLSALASTCPAGLGCSSR
jgi:phosphatidylglycerol lysyltransferase